MLLLGTQNASRREEFRLLSEVSRLRVPPGAVWLRDHPRTVSNAATYLRQWQADTRSNLASIVVTVAAFASSTVTRPQQCDAVTPPTTGPNKQPKRPTPLALVRWCMCKKSKNIVLPSSSQASSKSDVQCFMSGLVPNVSPVRAAYSGQLRSPSLTHITRTTHGSITLVTAFRHTGRARVHHRCLQTDCPDNWVIGPERPHWRAMPHDNRHDFAPELLM